LGVADNSTTMEAFPSVSVRIVDCAVRKFVSPPYDAWMELVPTGKAVVTIVATPLDRVPVPNRVLPAKKLTEPVAGNPLPETLAVSVRGEP
jgi:hypothetical protein